jgi:hypothetical protein
LLMFLESCLPVVYVLRDWNADYSKVINIVMKTYAGVEIQFQYY